MVWETPSNQYNHCILIQPSQKGGTVYFSWALRIPTHIGDNPSHLQDAHFVGSRSKHKCFSLAGFDVNHRVSFAFDGASDKVHADTFTRSAIIADSKRLISAPGARLMMAVVILQPIFGEDSECASSKDCEKRRDPQCWHHKETPRGRRSGRTRRSPHPNRRWAFRKDSTGEMTHATHRYLTVSQLFSFCIFHRVGSRPSWQFFLSFTGAFEPNCAGWSMSQLWGTLLGTILPNAPARSDHFPAAHFQSDFYWQTFRRHFENPTNTEDVGMKYIIKKHLKKHTHYGSARRFKNYGRG